MSYVSFDIDGTLVDASARLMRCIRNGSVDWDCFLDCGKLHMDRPLSHMIGYANSLAERGLGIILLTGRPERMRECTIRQLESYGLGGFVDIFMRPNDNHEPDPVYKAWAMSRILRRYRVVVHFDDNAETLSAIRRLGIDAALV